ncbi:hypothetical protein R70006_04963 [Paraburkholderia domus]|uniref:hypothetical protein n=1 Tax=Paraburkholderia domus TaxID=2793075 RepID=UPI001911E9D4|nr:hypothetical protein [Paraburkholderia domus]MBK5051801.1 hypothetical protein [Burkholderia sp. R-70006]CAE6793574.1 hypothetical protein R70006_04963 [Paraburkholderia domus]
MKLIPFGDAVVARESHEKIDDEVFSSIPALNSLAGSSLTLSTKLSLDARAALFHTNTASSPSLRRVSVELGVERRFAMEGATPDPEYLNGQEKALRQQFETPKNDIWLEPDGPGA